MVRAGYVCVAIIDRTLIWTTGSLSFAQMLIHAIAHGGVRTPKELTVGRKSHEAPGNRTCVSGVTVRCSNQLSYIPSQSFDKTDHSVLGSRIASTKPVQSSAIKTENVRHQALKCLPHSFPRINKRHSKTAQPRMPATQFSNIPSSLEQ